MGSASSSSRTLQQQDEGRKWKDQRREKKRQEDQDLTEGYPKTASHATTNGQDYEVALCSLFFLRALSVGGDFFLASNYEPAGKFDDVAIFYRLNEDPDAEYRAIFLQAKHRDNKKRNTLTTSQLKGYLESFAKIKDLWEKPLVVDGRRISLKDVFLVHYTNSGCYVEKAASEVTDLPELKEFLNTGGRLMRILGAKQVELPERQDTSNFLGMLLLCAQQTSVENADEFLKKELGKILGLTSVDDYLTSELKRVVKAWWSAGGRGRFLTADSEEWKGILQMQVRRMNGVGRMNLSFTAEALRELDIAIRSTKMTWIPVADKHQASVTRERLLRSEGQSLVLGSDYLESRWSEVEAVWGKSVCLALVVDLTSYPQRDEPSKLLRRLQMAAQADQGRHLAVIATEQPPSGGWNVVEPLDSWSALDADTQQRLLSVKVRLQGIADVEVRGIVGSSVRDVMTDKVIQSLSGTDAAIRLGRAMPAPLDYYVPRCLQRTSSRTITYQSLQNTNTLIVSTDLLDDTFPSDIKVNSWCDLEQTNKIDGLIFTRCLTDDSNIRSLCCKFRVKTVEGEGGNEGLTGEVTEFIPLTWICEDRVVVVEGFPGVGKSSYVTAMCCSVKTEFPECWVLRVDMARDTEYLKKADFTSKSDVMEFLLKGFRKDGLERHLLEHALRVSGNVFLFVDAFDEVSPDYTAKCCHLLEGIAEGVRFRQMVLTTRPVTTKDVEKVLEAEAFTLPVFSHEEQTLFFRQFSDANGEIVYEWDITYIQKVAGDIIEIPLLCKISAEVMLNRNDQTVFKYKNPWRRVFLYQLFVEQSVNHRVAEKFGLEASIPGVRMLLESNRTQHLRNLQGLAARKLLPTTELSDLRDGVPEEKFGLLVDAGDSVDFEHRTFAEFFLGRWLSDNWRRCPRQLLRDVFSEVRYRFVAATLSWSLFQDCPLHLAVARGDAEAAKELLEAPGATDGAGRSALHVAAMTPGCSREVSELLVASGEDANRKDDLLEKPAVDYAKIEENWDLLDVMLEMGARLENLNFITDQDRAKEVLLEAINRDLGNIVKYILTLNNQLLHVRGYCARNTLLHVASLNNSTRVLKLLIEVGLETNIRNELGCTALHLAAEEGHLDAVKILAESGGEINARNHYGDTPLHLVAREGHLDTLKFLMESGGEINGINDHRDTMLHCAAWGGHLDTVKFLIASGGDVNARNNDGEALLHCAAWGGDLDTVKFLMEIGGEINAISNDGDTLLHMAAREGHLDTLKFLMECGGEINVINNDGNTLLHCAARRGHLDTVKFLMESGGDVNSRNSDGDTLLHCAARRGHLGTVKFLMENGGETDVTNNDGDTLLHCAARRGDWDTVKFLMENGGDEKVKNKFGDTAVTLAEKFDNSEIVYFLTLNASSQR